MWTIRLHTANGCSSWRCCLPPLLVTPLVPTVAVQKWSLRVLLGFGKGKDGVSESMLATSRAKVEVSPSSCSCLPAHRRPVAPRARIGSSEKKPAAICWSEVAGVGLGSQLCCMVGKRRQGLRVFVSGPV